jgi:hypothetical protein
LSLSPTGVEAAIELYVEVRIMELATSYTEGE